MRQQLMQRLNQLQGVDIREDQLDKRPSFDLLLLREEGMRHFKEAFEWFYGVYSIKG